MFLIDLPNKDGKWDEVGSYDTYEEALEYVQTYYGADKQGRVKLISEVVTEEEDLDDEDFE